MITTMLLIKERTRRRLLTVTILVWSLLGSGASLVMFNHVGATLGDFAERSDYYYGLIPMSEPSLNLLDSRLGTSSWKYYKTVSASANLSSFPDISQLTWISYRNLRHTPMGRPAKGVLTSYYGRRKSPFLGRIKFHMGVDIANQEGTPVKATADGIVLFSGWRGKLGKLVVVDHGYGYITIYGHNSVLNVKTGDRVNRGRILAYMGSSGSSTGAHTHYEVWRNGDPINPIAFLGNPAQNRMAKKTGAKILRTL